MLLNSEPSSQINNRPIGRSSRTFIRKQTRLKKRDSRLVKNRVIDASNWLDALRDRVVLRACDFPGTLRQRIAFQCYRKGKIREVTEITILESCDNEKAGLFLAEQAGFICIWNKGPQRDPSINRLSDCSSFNAVHGEVKLKAFKQVLHIRFSPGFRSLRSDTVSRCCIGDLFRTSLTDQKGLPFGQVSNVVNTMNFKRSEHE